MVNFILGWNDRIILDSASISDSSTADSGYPAENLLDADRQTCFKTSDTGTVYVEFDLGASHGTVDGFAILNHNLGTKSSGSLLVKAANTTPAGMQLTSYATNTYVADDDFFGCFASAQNYRYWRFEITSVDAAGLYIGRIYLFGDLFDYADGVRLESQYGYRQIEDIVITKGGDEYRVARGGPRLVLACILPRLNGTDRSALEQCIEDVKLRHDTVISSMPFGSTSYTGAYRFGRAVHARFEGEELILQPDVGLRTTVPVVLVEVP